MRMREGGVVGGAALLCVQLVEKLSVLWNVAMSVACTQRWTRKKPYPAHALRHTLCIL